MRPCCQRSHQIVPQRRSRQHVEGRQRIGAGGRVGGIGFEQKIGRRPLYDVAREIDGDLDDKEHFALLKQLARSFRVIGLGHDMEIAGILQGRDHRTRERPGIVDGDGCGQVLGVEVDGKAEQEQLHQRHAR